MGDNLPSGDNMNWHLIPINDIRAHTEETTCECEPSIKLVDGDILVIHNAYDNREIIEQVEKILNKEDYNGK